MKFYLIFTIIYCCIGSILNAPPPPIKNELVKKAAGTAVDTGIDYVFENPLVPVEAKAAIAAGKAIVHGTKEFLRSNSLVNAGKAAMASGLESTNKVLLPEYSTLTKGGAALAKDLISGKGMSSSFKERLKEGLIDSIPGGQVMDLCYEYFNQNDPEYEECRKQLSFDMEELKKSLPGSSKPQTSQSQNKKLKKQKSKNKKSWK
ncbi:uncharacterized protein LOC116339794 [Contarinia nasturtii]|uniref:uncharacterized protein LOC116339794 n=1 Tax=Contarinia nasturtii TaxID=265458 RepID=UPI0012D42077|nr:uncharacterized protein LOC116339794 [Contarinia nasturtii]